MTEQIPSCVHTGAPLHVRAKTGSDFAWSNEGVVYSLRAHPLSYEVDYFFADYQKSYGKSYEEDEENLRQMARRRLDFLQTCGASGKTGTNPRMIEIGCAAGYFLDEARTRGYEPTGIEISRWARESARSRFGLNVFCKSFLDFETDGPDAPQAFDVVTAFYVIEHFADQRIVFEKISSLLAPGGLFLCALPSTNGPLMACNPTRWRETHPSDHYVDYSPASLRRILPLYGMEPVRFRPASYHRERSCGLMRHLPERLYRAVADARAFGDTLEFIARKTRHTLP